MRDSKSRLRPEQVSLVVTTYNWPEALDLVLESALRQNTMPGEVLVADDGSGESTAAVVRSFEGRFGARGVTFRHVWHSDRGFRLAEIRNRAIAAASGAYVLMVDGDCVLHPDFVRSHLVFARPGTFVQGTRVLLGRERAVRALARRETSFRPFERGVGNRANALSMPMLSRFVPTPKNPLKGVRGCNQGFWRDDALLVNGFDEQFVGWGREDSDFVARLGRADVRRRKLKFGGIVYHLWHPENARDGLEVNDALFAAAQRQGVVRCEDGIDKHLVSEGLALVAD